jgi:Ca2+-binding EF-hand superfamily protein
MKQRILIIALGLTFALTATIQLSAQETSQKYKNRYTQDLFNEADSNQDGYVTWEEMKSASKNIERNRMGRKRFNAADINNDGRLSIQEGKKYKGFEVRHRDQAIKRTKSRKRQAVRDSGEAGTQIRRTKKETVIIKRPHQKENVLDKKRNTRKRNRNIRDTETER